MSYNLSPYEIAFRYILMAAIVIIGVLTGHIWMMYISMAIFLTAILGICPIYHFLGIDHSKSAE